MNSKDLLARLLANENLNVIRANVATASFESITRTLTLPQWKDMTNEIEEMLIGHEVGHALYTTTEHMDKEDFRVIQGYMNVVEDVRIEKKVKNKYPGLRKSFIQGYKQLNEKDFFGVADKDLSDTLLIDRINLFYKVGINCGAKFTPAEMDLVRKVDRCDSMDDVYRLAREIYDLSKAEREEQKRKMEEMRLQNGEDTEDEDEDEDDAEFDNFMDDEDDFDNDNFMPEEELEEIKKELKAQKTSRSAPAEDTEKQEEQDLESKTEKAFRERLIELADTETVVQNFVPELSSKRDPIIPFKRILGELRTSSNYYHDITTENYGTNYAMARKNDRKQKLEKFKTESMRMVNYLVKEFEMRKSASEYKRITSAKSGDLDMRKLYAYTLTDDMFKKLDIIPEDKNHGMIFLLDWSGSMQHVMEDTVKQIINLAMFCQRIQIPYQVFAFSSGYENISWEQRQAMEIPNSKGFNDSQYSLLELFNNKMTNSEFNGMVELLHQSPWLYDRNYGLHSTPLNESLMFLIDYIGKFIKKNNVEKMSLVTLTDGEGHSLNGSNESLRHYTYSSGKALKVKNYLRDPITKKEYPLTEKGNEQTRTFLRVIKDRYNIKTVGFHIVSNSRRDIGNFVKNNLPDYQNGTQEFYAVEQLRKDIRSNDYALLTNTGRDELYLLPASKQRIEEGELEVKSDMNAKAIAKQFGKFLNVKKSSRVVLNRFVGVIA